MWSFPNSLNINTPEAQEILRSLPPLRSYPGWIVEETNNLLSTQISIATLRYNSVPFRKIIALLLISNHATLLVVIRLTAMGITWRPHMVGGSYSIFSDCLVQRLKNIIVWRRRGLNCMKTIEAKAFIIDEIEQFKKRAIKRLEEWHDES